MNWGGVQWPVLRYGISVKKKMVNNWFIVVN